MWLRCQTELPVSAPRAAEMIRQTGTFEHVVAGLFGVGWITPRPGQWVAGQELQVRLWLFYVVPTWRHTLRIVSIDPSGLAVQTEEHGGPLRRWNHRLAVAPLGEGRCRYSDELDIDSGPLTPLSWCLAWLVFHYRQSRLRRLVARTAS